MAKNDCIFCKIVAEDMPAQIIHNSQHALAFLDIHPINPGHSLVIPKKHVEEWQEIDEQSYPDVMETLRSTARRIKKVIKPPRVSILTHGVDIPHAHIHLIPMYKPADVSVDAFVRANQAEPDFEALAQTAAKLKF